MFKFAKNRVAEIAVTIEYEDVNNTTYEARAFVIVNSSYEIEAVRFSIIEAFDANGEPSEPEISQLIINQLETLAGAKALEKAQVADFEKENEND